MMKSYRNRFALVLALLVCALPATAEKKIDELRKTAEHAMLLTGSIDIDREGAVVAHAFDPGANLPDVIGKALRNKIAGWRFVSPRMETHATRIRAPMRLLIVLSRHGDDAIAMRIVSARFGDVPKEERLAFKWTPRLTHDQYPGEAYRHGVTGTVYLAVQIGRDGKPLQVIAEQVNLTVVDTEQKMARWREMLARSAVQMAKRWRFVGPSVGEEVDAPYWSARIPIAFIGSRATKSNAWQAYIPGPKQEVPWESKMDTVVGIGALAAGELHTVGTGLQLSTPLDDA